MPWKAALPATSCATPPPPSRRPRIHSSLPPCWAEWKAMERDAAGALALLDYCRPARGFLPWSAPVSISSRPDCAADAAGRLEALARWPAPTRATRISGACWPTPASPRTPMPGLPLLSGKTTGPGSGQPQRLEPACLRLRQRGRSPGRGGSLAALPGRGARKIPTPSIPSRRSPDNRPLAARPNSSTWLPTRRARSFRPAPICSRPPWRG